MDALVGSWSALDGTGWHWMDALDGCTWMDAPVGLLCGAVCCVCDALYCIALLDAEVRIGEILLEMPKASGGDYGNQHTGGKISTSANFATKPKLEAAKELRVRALCRPVVRYVGLWCVMSRACAIV